MPSLLEVLIDATAWSNPRGEGRYLRGVVPELLRPEAAGRFRFSLLCEREDVGAVRAAVDPPARVLSLSGGIHPGRRLCAGEPRRAREWLAPMRAVRALGPAVLLQPSLVGWFPTPGVPQVLGVHDVKLGTGGAERAYPRRRDATLAAGKEWIGLRSARARYAVSAATAASVARYVGERPPVARPAVGAAFRPRGTAAIAAARAEVGLDPEERYLVGASGLNRHKDPELVIEAMARGLAGGEHLPRVVLAGAWTGSYGSIGAELRARADSQGVGDRLLLPGRVDDQTLAALYSGAAAVVSASRFEGFGLTALEAAACGARTVLSSIPAHLETSASRAELFAPGDAAGLLAAVRRSLAKPPPEPLGPDAYEWSPAAAVLAGCLLSAVGDSSRARSASRT